MADSVVLKLQKQIQFYFSDANLRHDTFFRTHINESSDNFVDLGVIACCNAVKSLTKDIDVIRAAIRLCTDLELSVDGQKVKRIPSLPEVVNLDDQTIFVDNIPPYADHSIVKKLFDKFGTVEYISLPRYPGTGNVKGFAFIEFDSHESAKKAIKAFQDDSHLDQQVDMDCCDESLVSSVKGLSNKTEGTDGLMPSGKRALLGSQVAGLDTNSAAGQCDGVRTVEIKEESERSKEESKTEMQESLHSKSSIDVQKLQVMSKKEWSTMKQIYKKLQREQMGQLKGHLKESRQRKCQQSPTIDSIVPGSIIRIEGKLDGYKPSALRGLFALFGPIAYVDILPEVTKGYVRFVSCHGANQVISRWQEKTLPFSLQEMTLSLLEGEEENSYVERARQRRRDCLSSRFKQKRGRDKQCLSKAETIASSHKESGHIHIRFEDSSDEEEEAEIVEKMIKSCYEERDGSTVNIRKSKQKWVRKRKRVSSKESGTQ